MGRDVIFSIEIAVLAIAALVPGLDLMVLIFIFLHCEYVSRDFPYLYVERLLIADANSAGWWSIVLVLVEGLSSATESDTADDCGSISNEANKAESRSMTACSGSASHASKLTA